MQTTMQITRSFKEEFEVFTHHSLILLLDLTPHINIHSYGTSHAHVACFYFNFILPFGGTRGVQERYIRCPNKTHFTLFG